MEEIQLCWKLKKYRFGKSYAVSSNLRDRLTDLWESRYLPMSTHFRASSTEIGCLSPTPKVEWRKFQQDVKLVTPQALGYWSLDRQYLYKRSETIAWYQKLTIFGHPCSDGVSFPLQWLRGFEQWPSCFASWILLHTRWCSRLHYRHLEASACWSACSSSQELLSFYSKIMSECFKIRERA